MSSFVEKYLKEIAEAAGAHDCIYRGQANDDWDLENAAQRRIRKAIKKEESVENKVGKAVERETEAEVKNEVEGTIGEIQIKEMLEKEKVDIVSKSSLTNYHSDLLADAQQKGFGIRDGRELNDLEMLAELQHFGAATCLLDFTESPLVALYIACIDIPEKDGKLFILRNANLNTVLENDPIDKIIESEKLVQWRPPMHGEAERRIIRQSGVFIINLKPREKNLSFINIPKGDKQKIINELHEKYLISADTLFIDLAGFAENQSSEKSLPEALGSFYCGNVKYKEKDFDGAIKHYDKAIDQKPSHAQSYNNRGLAKIGKEYFDAAIEDFNKAIHLKPDYDDPYRGRGDVRLKTQNLDGAIADFTEAIRLKPDDFEAYRGRGVAMLGKHNFDNAIKEFDKAILVNPNYADAYRSRGVAKLLKRNLAGAIADFDEVISINSSDVEAYRGRGDAKLKAQDFAGATEDFSEVIRLKPNDAKAYFSLGLIKLRRNKKDLNEAIKDFDEAIKDFIKAIRLKPDFAEAHCNLGVAKLNKKDFGAAIKDFDEAIRLMHEFAEAYFYRGVAYMELDKLDKAQTDAERALPLAQQQKLSPDFINQIKKLLQDIEEKRKDN